MAEAEPAGALAGVKLLDLVDERGIYGAKLLADLGAEVVRVEPPDGDPLRRRGPFKDDVPGPTNSLWHAFFASNRRFATIDTTTPTGCRKLERLARWADVVIDSGTLAEAQIKPEALLAAKPSLVIVEVSSFGPSGPWRDYLAPDLVAGALGGLCATTGDVDTPPLKPFGELNFTISGVYTAIAALSALHHARETGQGQTVQVPVHETIPSCLEHVLMFLWYHQLLPFGEGPVLPRRGSLHWANAYQVMQAQGGSIMVTPTPDMQAQVAWLIGDGLGADLLDEKYQEPENLLLFINRVMEILREWTATKDVEPFFFEAQERHAPYGWVLPIDKVAANPQLEARQWWADYALADGSTRGPGTPYRFSDTPWRIARAYAAPGAETDAVLAMIGWDER